MRRWLRVFILFVFACGMSWSPAQDLDLEDDLLDLDENYGQERKSKPRADDFDDEFSLEDEPAPKPRPRQRTRPRPRPMPQPRQQPKIQEDFGLGEEDPFAEFDEEPQIKPQVKPKPRTRRTREADLDLNDEFAGEEDPFADFEEPEVRPQPRPKPRPKRPQRQERRQQVDELDEFDEFGDDSGQDEPFERYENPRKRQPKKQKNARNRRQPRNDFDFPDNKPYRYFVGGGYHLASTTNFSGGAINAGTSPFGFENFSAQFSHSSAPELTGGIISNRPRSFGFKAALTYQMKRNVSAVKYTASGQPFDADLGTSQPGLQLILAEGGGIYRWSDLYVLLTLNYPLVNYTAVTSETGGEVKMSGSINWSFGVGYRINREWTAELQLKQISVKATETADTYTADYGKGTLSGFAASVLYLF